MICHLNIYDEEEELIINGMYIRQSFSYSLKK